MNKKLQVFISSTYTDLIEERQAAVEAILDAGHIPAGMELFKAGNESQLKTIYKWIDESDVYMLILGGRYGSIETKSGKSYTQLEYEYALSKDIPIFAVVLSQSFLTDKINSLGLSNTMEHVTPDKYQSFKSLVMSKIIREVDDCKDIKITILSTLNEFMKNYDLIGWVRNTFPIENDSITKELRTYLKNLNIILLQLLTNNYYNFCEQFNTLLYNLNTLQFFYNSNKDNLNFFEIEFDSIFAFYKILAIRVDEIIKKQNGLATKNDNEYLFFVTKSINKITVNLLKKIEIE